MTDVAVLSIAIEADPKGLDGALAKIEASLAKLDKSGKGAGASIGAGFEAATPAARRAEAATLGFAQARARLLRDQGDLSGAERVLAGALQQTTASTTRTIAAERQLLAVRKQLAQAGQGGQSFLAGLTQTAGNVDKLIGAVAGLGGAFAAAQAAQAAFTFAQTGAQVEAARASFDRLAASAGTSGKALLAALNEAAAGTVRNTDLIKSSNTALLLLGSDVASQLPQLLAVAKASATALGTDVGQVFDSLVTGIARGSTELIDNAGITVKAGEAYAAYAASVGKSADSLSAAERQQAILNAVLTSGQTIIAQTGGGADGANASFQRFSAGVGNLTTTLQTAAATGAAPFVGWLGELAQAASDGIASLAAYGDQIAALNARILGATGGYQAYVAQVQATNAQIQASYGVFGFLAGTIQPLSEAAYALRDSLVASGVGAEAANASALQYDQTLQTIAQTSNLASLTMGELSAGYSQVATEAQNLLASNAGLAPEIAGIVAALNDHAITAAEASAQLAALATEADAAALALWRQGEGATGAAQATAEVAAMLDTSAVAAAAQRAALGEATQAAYEAAAAGGDLEAQARAAADALLAAGPAGAAMAAQLAGSSSQVDVLTAAFYRLAAAKAAALGGGGGALGNLGGVIKGAGQATAAIRALNRVYGAGPLAPSSGGGRGGGGGGGGGKSDAERQAEKDTKARGSQYEKLLNIQERYQERASDAEQRYQEAAIAAEQRYQERILDIQERFAEAQLAAQRKLALDGAKSRTGFYEGLIDSDLPQQAQQALSAAYEAAFAESQRLAQTGNADIADAYLDLKRRQIDAERDYQERIAGLKDIRDRKERENERKKLDAIKALRDREFAVEEAQLKDGTGSAAADRDRALAEAGADRQEALDKAAADRADALTQAQIDAQGALAEAERKKADAAAITNTQLQTQLDLVRQIALTGGAVLPPTRPVGTPAAGAPGAVTPTVTPTVTAPGLGAAASGGPTPVIDSAALTALDGVRRALQDIERALRAGRPNYSPGG